ncbi:S4 domain-containing protein [Comamonas avium]|uniref:Dual-specificity RNA pseudouridine synthase RluF n=1 Tax=Comamonas avium TaxID=2762231 RepID=A0ABR8SB96_9BURK|nr:S4 domain-containing protein [Comamonas avium]MBD7960771.1 RNA-binding protein [Comamonas avium]
MSQTEQPKNNDNSVRLSKRLAEQLQCSRAEAELYIEHGTVKVDGVTVETLGARVRPEQEVTVQQGAKAQAVPPVTIFLHKPAGYTVHAGGRGAKNALELLLPSNWNQGDTPAPIRMLQKHFQNLECLTPIPVPASGLTIFTQDRRMVRKLTEEALYIEQECIAHVQGTMDEDGLERLCEGTSIEGKRLPRIKVSWQSDNRLRFALKGIFPEEIDAMCRGVGLQLIGLKRLRVGRISMAKLEEAQWRYAMPWERF